MTQVLNPADTNHASLTIPTDGESNSIDSIKTTFQHLLNLTEVMRQSLLHIANSDVVVPGSRNIEDGVKRCRTVADLAALGALSVGSANNKEIAIVLDMSDAPAMYQYYHGAATALLSPFIVDAASSTGRWFWVGTGLIGQSPGIPYTNSAGKLTGVTTVAKTVVQTTELSTNGTAEDISGAFGITDSDTSYVDDASCIYTLTGIQTGDIIDVEYSFHGRFDEADSEQNRVVCALHIGQSGSFTKFGTAIFMPPIGGTTTTSALFPLVDTGTTPDVTLYAFPLEHATIRGKYTAVSNVDVVIKPMLKSVGSGTILFRLYSPAHGTARVIRP